MIGGCAYRAIAQPRLNKCLALLVRDHHADPAPGSARPAAVTPDQLDVLHKHHVIVIGEGRPDHFSAD